MNTSNVSPERTGLGFHYFPDEKHYRALDMQAWLPELQALGVRWLTLHSSLQRAIPEPFLSGLLGVNIQPIIHLPLKPGEWLDREALRSLAQSYARWGVEHLVVYDRPNARASWPDKVFDQAALVERFLDHWIPAMHALQAFDLAPIFPPLEQGGTYWDTSFLKAALESLQARGQYELLENLMLGSYAFTGPHPPDWGKGGPHAWPATQPYLTPPGSQDQLGFHAFEWYADVLAGVLGNTRPILTLAGGACLGEKDPTTGELLDMDWHTTCNTAIATAIHENSLPDYLLNVNFWLLASDPTTANDEIALANWYRSDGTTVPAVTKLKQFAGQQDKQQAKTFAPAHNKSGANGKSLYHYLLLPTYDWGPSEWHWQAASEYARRFQPACGYSAEEAELAQFVTLVGDEQGIGEEIERRLWQSGCKVERIVSADLDDTRARLNTLVEQGRRFFSGIDETEAE